METEKDRELWKLAKKRVGFRRHLLTYIVMNVFFWAIWYFTDHREEDRELDNIPWPLFPMLGWGLGVAFNYLNAFVFSKPQAVEREYEKLKNRRS